MYYLVYISTSVKLNTEDELSALLTQSREKNLINNITGLLLYAEGMFIQLLEGSEADVKNLYRAIELDPRHYNLILLVSGHYQHRMFGGWSMGYAVADKAVVNELTGYVDPAKEDLLTTAFQTPALIVLKTFVENNRISG